MRTHECAFRGEDLEPLMSLFGWAPLVPDLMDYSEFNLEGEDLS